MSIRAQTPAVTSGPSGGAEQRLRRVLTLGQEKRNFGNAAAAPDGESHDFDEVDFEIEHVVPVDFEYPLT